MPMALPEDSCAALAERDARDRFLNIAATCPDAIMCATADGRIIFWNVRRGKNVRPQRRSRHFRRGKT